MIRVIDKTFKVLEAIVAETPQAITPKRLAEKLDLTLSTVSHILKMLLDSGYIRQISRQAGYVAGPKLAVLSNIADFEGKLLAAGKPLVDRVAESIQDAVLISKIYGDRRYVLYLKNRNPHRELRLRQAGTRDVYGTATGIAEMAYRPWQAQVDDYRQYAKSECLPEAADEKSLPRLFEQVRKDGFFTAKKRDMGIFAVPVLVKGEPVATLGCNIPETKYATAHIKKILEILVGAAAELSSMLSDHEV